MASAAALPRSFYERSAIIVARELLGMVLIHAERRGRIVEVEAYPPGDPAAHSFRGRTPRTEVLFGPGGHAYVYLSYGVHECLNVSCEPAGSPGCVLIRGLDFVTGPGRLTKAMGVTRAHYGADLTSGTLRIERGKSPESILATPRIGITKAVENPWRFVVGCGQ